MGIFNKEILRVFYTALISGILLIVCEIQGSGAIQTDNKKDVNENLPVLNVYTWVDFIDPEIFSDFEKEFHAKVHVDFYNDEEVMFSSIQSQPGQYDIIFPSDSLTEVMLESKLLSKLELRHIPNVRYLKELFRNITNRKWKGYSIPIDWGVTGIAYNSEYVKEPVDSWGIFRNTKYKGKMALLNNSYDVMTVGQKCLGYSLNPTNPRDIDESAKVLKEMKPLLQGEGFMPYDEIMDKMKNEVLWVAQCYNGDAALVNKENNAVKFVMPKEGSAFWLDNLAVPDGSKNKRLAEKFINFMLRPEISAKHTNFCYYASCNKKAVVFVDKEVIDNPYVCINKKEMKKLELYEILNPEVQKRLNECWAELQKY